MAGQYWGWKEGFVQMTKKVFPCSPDSSPALLCPKLEPVFLAHQNPWFKVMSRGSYYTMEYERPQVVILPILERDSMVMVRVRRPLIDDCPLELPAGDSKHGESPRAAAMREFAEETGIHIEDPLRFVPDLSVSEMPGRMPILLGIFRVDLSRAEFYSRMHHDNEIISVEAIPLADVVRKIVDGELYISSPVAIISRFLFKKYMERSIILDK